MTVAVVGCGGRNPYLASDLTVDRVGWDSLMVRVAFVEKQMFGDPIPVVPDSFEVRLFSSDFDTLYVGHDSLVVVPDPSLGDRESALVEACGFFGSDAACGQLGIEASPKRVRVSSELVYPDDGDYDRGRYRFSFAGQRSVFGADTTWEDVPMPSPVRNRLSIRVLGEYGEPIDVPLATSRGRFKLTNLRNNADFRRDLLAQLLDADEATVRFELYSSAFGLVAPVWVSDTVVESKTAQTRELEAGYFVEEAGSRLLDLLRTFPVGPNVYLFMNDWAFDRDERMYTIGFSLSWQSSFLRSRWFELEAQLKVRESGTEPRITVVSANERGMRRWEQRFDGPEIMLDSISPRPEARSNRGVVERGDDD